MNPQAPARTGPFIITVFGGKGGIGKTTIAEHLAWGFGPVDQTLLVDAEGGQRSAKRNFDRYAVQAPFDIAVETDPHLLGNLKKVPHRFVVIDAPPSADEAAAAVGAADLVIVPMIPRVMDISAIMETIRAALSSGQPYCVLLSRVTNTMGTSRVNAVKGSLVGNGVPVLGTVVREYLGPHELARTHGYPVTHPDLPSFTNKSIERERIENARKDLSGVFQEVARRAGVAA